MESSRHSLSVLWKRPLYSLCWLLFLGRDSWSWMCAIVQELDIMGCKHVMVQRSWNELSEDAALATLLN